MFSKKTDGIAVSAEKVDTIFGSGTEFIGKIKAAGILRIEGKVEGEIESTGDVIITESGTVKADIKARHAVIAGSFNGNAALEGKMEIKATGKVIGDIKVASIIIEDGGLLEGRCEMQNLSQERNLKLVKNEQAAK
ncbi:MAG: polymer-forming cytoskeletal protein [Tepidanaerobacteraceae bacterium]|jgi:cytoskeletal protein CcmA (bactofilin family)|nr:polymer-forming cytoskeletal protein [Tepidanaerobacteraceae bacterium]